MPEMTNLGPLSSQSARQVASKTPVIAPQSSARSSPAIHDKPISKSEGRLRFAFSFEREAITTKAPKTAPMAPK